MTSHKPKVIVTGALGKMGSNAVKTFINNSDRFELIAASVRDINGLDSEKKEETERLYSKHNIQLIDNLENFLNNGQKADILVELSNPSSVYQNSKLALENYIRPVIGATGLSEAQIEELRELAIKQRVGAIIAPNFAIGAILMMQFAQKAVEYFDKYEITELHHDQKLDAPSGTAIKTAQLMQHAAEHCNEQNSSNNKSTEIPIHSVRLPGLVAHQEVIFGGLGQTLTVRHDTIDRSSFMPGILLACDKVMELENLVYGLDKVI